MHFLRARSFFGKNTALQRPLPGGGIALRHPEMHDFEAWVALRASSYEFLRPWEPVWPSDCLTRETFRARLKYYRRSMRADTAYQYHIFRQEDDALVGGLTLSNVRRGVAQTGSIGYWMGEPYAGKGYMAAAMRLFLRHAFGQLQLRRIEAACLPDNEASIRVLKHTGFTREGYARAYLCIAGEWRDHYLYAILANDGIRQKTTYTRIT